MSVVTEIFIVCDGVGNEMDCYRNYGVDSRQLTAKQHRAKFRVNGWRHIKGKDYCPVCDRALKLKQKEGL